MTTMTDQHRNQSGRQGGRQPQQGQFDQQRQFGQQNSLNSAFQETTIEQSQQALEQAMKLQHNAARMTLSILEWQDTAQRQGLEITKSVLENYLQSMQSFVPEMEEAMEQGMETVQEGAQAMGAAQEGMQAMGGSQQFGQQGQQYPQTGEWVSQPTQQSAAQPQGQSQGGRQFGQRRPQTGQPGPQYGQAGRGQHDQGQQHTAPTREWEDEERTRGPDDESYPQGSFEDERESYENEATDEQEEETTQEN